MREPSEIQMTTTLSLTRHKYVPALGVGQDAITCTCLSIAVSGAGLANLRLTNQNGCKPPTLENPRRVGRLL